MRASVLLLQGRSGAFGTMRQGAAKSTHLLLRLNLATTTTSSAVRARSTKAGQRWTAIATSAGKKKLPPSNGSINLQNRRRSNFTNQNRRGRSISRFNSATTAATTTTTIQAPPVSAVDLERKEEESGSSRSVTAIPTTAGKPWMLDLGAPSMVPEWRKMFHKDTLFNDVSAGLTVGCVAVPLSLAIAVSSGVPAEVGLVTAAVSGIAGGLMGGTTLAVTGPAAAISLLVVGAVQQHGLEALPFITLGCGVLQLGSGVTRLGTVAKLMPVSVIAGFTTGVGTLILSGQVPKALGMAAPSGLNPVELVGYMAQHASAISPSSAALALGTSAAMFALPKLHAKMPSALLAVGGATLATHTLGLDVALVGAIPSGLQAFQFGVPSLPPVDSLASLCASTLLIYGMTSVESLLSCASLEKMKKTSYKHNPDQELVGQGLSNMASAFFMGMPVTSVIARSSLNVRSNAETRLPALVQAGFVFSSVVFMSESIAMIPMPALSGMLITTGIGMLNPTEFKHCFAVQKSDALPFAATFGGMISLGLAEGIGIGCVTALALNKGKWQSMDMAKMKFIETSAVMDPTSAAAEQQHLVVVDDAATTSNAGGSSSSSVVYKLQGPINFMSMFVIDKLAQRIQQASFGDAVVLDMQGVTTLEFTGVEELVNRLLEVGSSAPIRMIHCSEALHNALDQCDPLQQIERVSSE